MGSLFSPQKLTTKQNASTSALQPYAGAYQDLLTRGLDVSNTAYNPATNAGVAGFSDPQRAAFGLTQQNVGSYQPYLAAATGAASLGSAPSYANVGQYMNPFDQYVTGSLINDYDQMINRNRQMNMSDAAKAGALTGDRRYVAQSIGQEGLDRALASNLAQTRQQGYNTALQTAQADALRGLQSAGILSNLGGLAQQYGYNDINAMLGIGGLQQGQQQKELDTATANAIRESAYPFETAQWASNYATGLGGAAGSSSTGKTISPGPSIGQQIIGAIAAGAGAAAKGGMGAKDGGAIHGYAQGGTPFFGGLSYVPQMKMQSKGLAPAQFVSPAKSNTGMNKMLESFNTANAAIKGLGGLNGMFSTPISTTKDDNSGWETTTNQSGFMPWLKNQFSGLGNLTSYLPSFNFNHGGVVRHGYQFGGLTSSSPFDYYSSYVPDNSNDINKEETILPDPTAPDPVVTASNTAPNQFSTFVEPSGLGGLNKETPKDNEGASLFGFNMSPEAADALMAAGFGMMASNSPFPLQAAGEGGLAGLGYYSRAMKAKQEQENELKKALIQHSASGNKPSAIQVYEYIKKLPVEERADFYKSQRGEKWIDGGTYWKNSETGEEIPKNIFGAKEQEELGKKSGEKKADLGTVNSSYASTVLTDRYLTKTIQHAKNLAGAFTTGFAGTVGATIAGSPSSDLAIAMRNIEANLAFDSLKDLKASGGSLGAVSESELSLLKASLIALNQAQSYEEFVRALDELMQIKAEKAAARKGAYDEYIQQYGEGKVPDYVKKAIEGTLVPKNNSNVRTYNPNSGTAN